MILAVALIFGGIFGYQAYTAYKRSKSMASRKAPPVTVTAMEAEFQPWRLDIKAVGTMRAMQGVDVTSEIAGLVRSVSFQSGDHADKGQVLVQLNAEADIARLHSLEAEEELASTVYERDKRQFAVKAVSQATLDADAADLKSSKAEVAQQAALVDKKTIRAPFSGRLGITTINDGQYINPGDRIVTLQALDSMYADFFLPQKDLSRITVGQEVKVHTDAYPDTTFAGRITAINPEVDITTRNAKIEAKIDNPEERLLPGMFATVTIQVGEPEQYLTLPQTAVSYQPYGDTVYIVQEKDKGPEGKPELTVKQVFITVGPVRGDQVAIIKGISEGDRVVTSGQLKLRNGSRVNINNEIRPSNEPSPEPEDY